LVSEEGLDEAFVINAGGGILRTQIWHYPSRQECMLCHTPAGGFVLGFSTAQLNRDLNYSGVVTNQIATLSEAGYFESKVTGIHTLPALAHPTNESASLEYRARSYLAANCVYCHQPGGVPQALWDGRFSTPTASAGLVNGPLVNYGSSTNNRTLKPGSLSESMILTRIATLGAGRMPPLASSVLDETGIRLISAWITNDLPSYQTFADWQNAKFGGTNAPDAQAGADPDKDRAINELEYLTGTDPLNAASYWSISAQIAGSSIEVTWPQVANRGFELQRRKVLSGTQQWSALDVAGNEPFFSSTNRTGRVVDGATNAESYYRVRVFAP
jgi:mono/diheme cytochrome c family protein